MSVKPATVPTWNTGGANRTTPSGGQQVTGFATGDQVPSGWMNWFLYWAFTWIQYLSDGVFSSSTSPGVTGVSTSASVLTAGVQGSNTNPSTAGVVGLNTGDLSYGVYGTVTGIGATGVLGFASGAASGNGVTGTSQGLGGNGVQGTADPASGSTSCAGVLGEAAERPNSDGVRGVLRSGSSDLQAGVLGDGSACSGYGVTAKGDTTTPLRSALRVVPQDTVPVSAQEGDIYFNSTTHLSYRYNGTAWVDFTTAYRCRTVATSGSLPAGVVGDLCVAADTGKLYIHNGGSWVVVGTQT